MGKVGEKLEGLESYLWVVLEREEVVRGGGSTAGGGRQWYCAAAAAFRRGWASGVGPWRISGRWRSYFGGRLGWRKAGGGSAACKAGGSHGGRRGALWAAGEKGWGSALA